MLYLMLYHLVQKIPLEPLKPSLTLHAVRYITVIDKRYASLKEASEPLITVIEIKK
jgi:hypothetical protein